MYQHVIAIYHQDFLFFEDSPVVAFLFFLTFSLERLSLGTAGFSVRSKHFSKHSMSLCSPVKIYSHGISMPNPLPLLTAFPHTLTAPLVPGFARKCLISPKPSFVLTNIKGMCPTTRPSLTMLTGFLSFGFSGSGWSCRLSPLWGVHQPL